VDALNGSREAEGCSETEEGRSRSEGRWLAHAYPEALVSLLEVIAGDHHQPSDGVPDGSEAASRRSRHASEVNSSSGVVGINKPKGRRSGH
jgi:hypothetical protein